MAYVILPLEDAAPAEGAEQALGALIVRPEFGQVTPGLGRTLLEGGHQAVSVAFVPLLRQHHHVNQMGDPPRNQ